MSGKPKFVIFAHNATYDKLHQVATLGLIAAAIPAAAMGKDVIVVLLFWTIKKLAEGKIDEIDFPPEYADSAEQVARLLKEKKVPKISEMFQEARLVGHFRLIACSAGLEYMGVAAGAVERTTSLVVHISLKGWWLEAYRRSTLNGFSSRRRDRNTPQSCTGCTMARPAGRGVVRRARAGR